MRQLLKSTTALVLASALAVPQPLWAQGEADPELERRDQLLQNQADQAHQQAQEAAAEEARKAAEKAERQAERKAERKEERKEERKAERQAERQQQRQEQSEVDAEAAAHAEAEAAANAQADADANAEAQEEGELPDSDQADVDAAEMERQQRREQRRAERQARRAAEAEAEAQAAAAASDEADGEVIEERITDENVRSSDEEFAAAPQATAPAAEEDDGISDLGKIAILGLGALAVGQMLKNGDRVVSNSGDRVVVQTDDGMRVLKNDNVLLRQPGADVRTETFSDGSTRSYVTYADGTQVVTVLSAEGRMLRRTKILPNGEQVVLFDDTRTVEPVEYTELPQMRGDSMRYEGTAVSDDNLRRALMATQPANIDRRFSLSQIRNIDAVRYLVPEIEVESVKFATGSSAIGRDQAQELAALGGAMREAIQANPADIFLIEGHTDAVGAEDYNLMLSDRRAETVALALTEYFDVPPENMVVQGYGEYDLRVQTQAAERANRRVAVRRITPLLNGGT